MFVEKNRLVRGVLLGTIGCMAVALAGCANTPSHQWSGGKVFGELAYQKQRGEELAIRVKQALQPGAPEYQESEALYDEARLRYNAYAQQLLSDYVANRSTDLSMTAASAASASEAFREYVVKTVRPRGVEDVLKAAQKVGDFGFGLYEQYQKEVEARRKAAAAEILPKIQWRAWSEIEPSAKAATQ